LNRSPTKGRQLRSARTDQLFRQRTFALRWDTGKHAAREEPQIVELPATSFEMGAAGFLVSDLGALENGGGAHEGTVSMLRVKP
jgi:hypothetical protein